MAAATNPSSSEISAANSASSTSEPNPTRRKPMARPALHPDRAARMGLCPRLSDLRSACRRAAGLAPSLQLASTPRRDKIPNADQPPRPIRGRPVEAPQLVEAGASYIALAVVMDRDLLDRAQVDIAPHRLRTVVRIDDLEVPIAGPSLPAEMDVGCFAVFQHLFAEDIILPVIRLAWRDIDFLQLVAGAVDQPEILLGLVGDRRRSEPDRNRRERGEEHDAHCLLQDALFLVRE